ncbi:piggyBac transposable element-derived protein 3-like isoform X1 [Bactrocera neohumeralis]|uniref:piggyBac transposable element-derived protein 3-like isoform X1 n=1 Tax=Bactrocera neohumeralis TaxID=98809 RepID=UPI0021663936|nr:piggyBac transposable element-derived protein 3-like isoform X1 [Bactrocera neohumeralis]
MPNKPHKWGIKFFVLCDTSGFAYRFEVYNGAGDNVILPGQPDLGATSNVVVRLSQTIPNFRNHILYFDNFYTSLPLLVLLRARGIFSLGTLRIPLIPNCKLPNEKDIRDELRDYSCEYMKRAYGVDITTVLWKDNKLVRLASTYYVGVQPFQRSNTDANKQPSKAARYDRKAKKYLEIDCPQIIKAYNNHMGGVDLMDALMGRYHIRAKSNDAITRLFYHFIDMAITNAYLPHKRIYAKKVTDSSHESAKHERFFQLPRFREAVAASLITYQKRRPLGCQKTVTSKVGNIEPSNSGVGQKSKHPVHEVRYDGQDHFPIWLGKEGGKKWCKLCKKSQTQCAIFICAAPTQKTVFWIITIKISSFDYISCLLIFHLCFIFLFQSTTLSCIPHHIFGINCHECPEALFTFCLPVIRKNTQITWVFLNYFTP